MHLLYLSNWYTHYYTAYIAEPVNFIRFYYSIKIRPTSSTVQISNTAIRMFKV